MDARKRNGLFGAAAILAAVGFFVPTEGYQLIAWLSAALLASAGVIITSARQGILATSLVCIGANGYLFSQKFEGAGESLCNVNEVLNCDIVNSSAASEAFGIPITLLGMGFYGGLALAAMVQEERFPQLFRVNTLFALVNLVYSAWLAYQAKLLGAVCVMCITIYIGNGLLLWAGLRGLKAQGKTLFDGIEKAATSRSLLTIARPSWWWWPRA